MPLLCFAKRWTFRRERRSPRKAQLSEVRHPDPARPAELRVITPEGVTVLGPGGGPPSPSEPPQLPPRGTGRPSPPPVPPSRHLNQRASATPSDNSAPTQHTQETSPEDTEVAGLGVPPPDRHPAAPATSCSGCPSPELPLPPPPPLDPLASEMTTSDEPLPPPPPDLTALVDAAMAHTSTQKTVYPRNSYMSYVSVRKPCRRHGYDGNYRRTQNTSPPSRELDSSVSDGSSGLTCPFCQVGSRTDSDCRTSPHSPQTVMCDGPECETTRTLSNQVQGSRPGPESKVGPSDSRSGLESRGLTETRNFLDTRLVQEPRSAQETRAVHESRTVAESRSLIESRLAQESRTAQDPRASLESRISPESRTFPESRSVDSRAVLETRAFPESRVIQESRSIPDPRTFTESRTVQESRTSSDSRTVQSSKTGQEPRIVQESRETQEQKQRSRPKTDQPLDTNNNNSSVHSRNNNNNNNNNNYIVNASKVQMNKMNLSELKGGRPLRESRVVQPLQHPDSYIVLPIDLGEPTKDEEGVAKEVPPSNPSHRTEPEVTPESRKWEGGSGAGSRDEELDRLSRSFAERCGDQTLKNILAPGPDRVQLWDYMEGVFSREELLSRSKERTPKHKEATATPNNNTSASSPQAALDNDKALRNSSKVPVSSPTGSGPELPAHSAYFTTSEPKAKLLTRLSQTDMLNGQTCTTSDSSDLCRKKEELISSISRKLTLLRSEQLGLQEEVCQNEKLGREVAWRVEKAAKPNELQKYRLHVEETEKILNLLMSLSGRLARAQNALRALPTDADPDERHLLEAKRDKLSSQHEEARTLKESLDRRGRQVESFLKSYLSEEEFADYLHFVAMKAKLLVDARELDEKIRLGEEQLAALERRTRPQDTLGRNGDWGRNAGATSV